MSERQLKSPPELLASLAEDYAAGEIAGMIVTLVFKDGRGATYVVDGAEPGAKEALLENIQGLHRVMMPTEHIRTRCEPTHTHVQVAVPSQSTRREIELWARLLETGHAPQPPLRIEFWTGEFVYAEDDEVGVFRYGDQIALYEDGRVQMM